MAILNYSSKISASRTIGEISEMLIKKGIKKIVTDYDDQGIPIALTFTHSSELGTFFFALPCNWKGVFRAMEKDINIQKTFKTKEQAIRTAWRIVKDWVTAQMAIIEANLAGLVEVFLPYAVTIDGNTLYNNIIINHKYNGLQIT